MLSHSIHSELVKVTSRHSTVTIIVGLTIFAPLMTIALISIALNLITNDLSALVTAMQNPNEIKLLIFQSSNLFCLLLSSLVVTTEYGTSVIYRTYQVFRKRLTALFGKLIVIESIVLATSIIAFSITVFILNFSGIEMFHIDHPLILILFSAVNCFIIALFSYGISLILSRTIPVLVTTIGIFYILPGALSTVFAFLSPSSASDILYLPINAASSPVQAVLQGTSYSGVHPIAGVTLTLALSLLLVVIGCIIQLRRDI